MNAGAFHNVSLVAVYMSCSRRPAIQVDTTCIRTTCISGAKAAALWNAPSRILYRRQNCRHGYMYPLVSASRTLLITCIRRHDNDFWLSCLLKSAESDVARMSSGNALHDEGPACSPNVMHGRSKVLTADRNEVGWQILTESNGSKFIRCSRQLPQEMECIMQ